MYSVGIVAEVVAVVADLVPATVALAVAAVYKAQLLVVVVAIFRVLKLHIGQSDGSSYQR